jgi:endoglycosylceramidase
MNFIYLFFLFSPILFAQGQSPLSFQDDPRSNEITIGQKNYNGQKDFVFYDGLGREVYFRGWNVSGGIKLSSMGFKPFKNTEDANFSFGLMEEKTGSNAVRFTISWEGVQPDVNEIDEKYLRDITSQIKTAIAHKIYVLLDFHQDLYSRYLFHPGSKYTGNGAPKFIIEGGDYPPEECFICFHWGMANKLNKVLLLAVRNFWSNSPIHTKVGERRVQDEFLWQMEKVLAYLKKELTPQEFSFILGLDPFNEPIDGETEGVSDTEWNKTKIYSFYFKVRNTMDRVGWNKKIMFPEPLVFWNTNAPTVNAVDPFYPEFVENPPQGNWAFNTHYYDAFRMSVGIRKIRNGAYIGVIDHIRNTARRVSAPSLISEFGMFRDKENKTKKFASMVNAVYQGMEISKELDSNFAEFYTPLVSGLQWQWDLYHNQHQEPLNFTDQIISSGDGWNGEDFSIITEMGRSYTSPDQYIVERSWPKRCQGKIMHFFYNARPSDLDWGALKFSSSDEDYHLNKIRFSFLAWKGKNSNAPTEIFIPPHFDLSSTYLITENEIQNLGNLSTNDIKVDNTSKSVGHTVYIWNRVMHSDYHFALIVPKEFSREYLVFLQTKLKQRIFIDEKSPIYLTGDVKIDKVPLGRAKIPFDKIKKNEYYDSP